MATKIVSTTSRRGYWILAANRDLVVAQGMMEGWIQIEDGRPHLLDRLTRGDWVVCYSKKTLPRRGRQINKFTAIGRVADTQPYPAYNVHRRRVEFLEDYYESQLQPLIYYLQFITNKKKWYKPFRRTLFPVKRVDFDTIVDAMGCIAEVDKARPKDLRTGRPCL